MINSIFIEDNIAYINFSSADRMSCFITKSFDIAFDFESKAVIYSDDCFDLEEIAELLESDLDLEVFGEGFALYLSDINEACDIKGILFSVIEEPLDN